MNSCRLDDSDDLCTATSPKKIIYDFGANNGDDIPYYLKKAELVVAVEANPSLCQKIEERFLQRDPRGEDCGLKTAF